MAASWSGRSTTGWCVSCRRPASKSDPTARPFVIFDPRAGHGPGIGGFKADSEIGVAMQRRPSLLFRRLPARADARTDHRGHRARGSGLSRQGDRAATREADGKPCVIGNCQAGWAVMMLAAIRPELFGPIIVAGSPLSYWAGVRGKIRCATAAGCWAEAGSRRSTSDLGAGKFDGAWLVQNFENQNPANTLLDQAVQSLFQDRHRGRALSRLRALVGRARQSQRRGNPVHRRRIVRRQQARRRPDQDFRRHRDRPAQHSLADRGVLLKGRQHHAAAAGARLDSRPIRRRRRDPLAMGRPSSTPFTTTSGTSGSSCRRESRASNTASSPTTST